MKFDLHIHSIASKYKESDGIVDNSTIDNVGVLLKKLDENEVGLFSITDHNRFDANLYNKLDNEIRTGKYKNVKSIVAGVEFDVQMDDNMEKCHIITIFDAKNKEENYKKIKECIGEDELKNEKDYYTRDRFERILKKINLDVILIACQRNSLGKHDGKHNSLSESTRNPEILIETGYINALEFQRPNVEGILKNDLRRVPVNIGLVMGSDCHDWSVYPKHDKLEVGKQFTHSRAKILPTFKGLLMAITSPETRINQQNSKNTDYIEKFKIGEETIKLANGINAIIGENGSGKSTLLKLLNNKTDSPKYIKEIVENNGLKCDYKLSSKILSVEQGEIVQKFDKCTLFSQDNFSTIPHDSFKNTYSKYAEDILSYIRKNIKKEESINGLKKKTIEYSELNDMSTYFINIECDKDFSNIDNIHDRPKNDLTDILDKLEKLKDEDYYKNYKVKLSQVTNTLKDILCEINKKYNTVKNERIVKNIITCEISEYNNKIKEMSTTQENDQRDFILRRDDFISDIVDAIKIDNENIEFPQKPITFDGFSTNSSVGFSFNSESNYNGRDVHDEFLSKMFNQDYSDIEKLKSINDETTLAKAITGCISTDQIDDNYRKNLNKFLEKMCECKNYIIDISNEEKSLGSTLGEQSLAYFKYITSFEKGKHIFLIDQPEDHISNNNISKKLLKYLNAIRNNKQIIIVTHNPLLVVNLDVDQVIYVEKNNKKISIISGCLEFEDDSINILKLIADNMDGGKESIRKRLKVYEQNSKN